LIRHFKKRKKSCFFKSEKKRKIAYVFPNTGSSFLHRSRSVFGAENSSFRSIKTADFNLAADKISGRWQTWRALSTWPRRGGRHLWRTDGRAGWSSLGVTCGRPGWPDPDDSSTPY